MKTLTSTLLFVSVILNFARAGERALWATMLNGGSNNMGVIYKVNPDGTNGTVAVTFSGGNGANPSGNMVQGLDGKLYGTTTAGGMNNCGVLFSYDIKDSTFALVHSFDSVDGWAPRDLLLAADGKIYGTTQAGGTHNSPTALQGCGVIYCYDPAGPIQTRFTKLYDFDGLSGENPQGLVQANDNKLYGLTRQGGGANLGSMYSYTPGSPGISTLFDFNNTNGALPTNCKLIQATDRKLYGMTTWGGVNNIGVLFSYDIQLHRHVKLYDFIALLGSYPSSSLLEANNGVLYGVSLYGGANDFGVIFKYNIAYTSYSDLYNFNGAQGAVPFGSLIQATNNLLYGMTTQGGSHGIGVIYDYNISADAFGVVRNCDGTTAGGNPMSNLLELGGATGIENIAEQQISFYPNPATNEMIIQTGDFRPETLAIYDLNGQLLNKVKFANLLDISSLSPGFYFVEAANGNNLVKSRFIKM